jgi:hypothetical protein
VSFQNLVVKIFKSHGFEIDSTSNYNKYILATKDSIVLSIGYAEPGKELSMGDLRKFFRTAKRDNADRMIFVMPGTFPTSFERFADERNIQLWDRERFEREIGRAVVTDIESQDKFDSFDEEFSSILKPTTRTKADKSRAYDSKSDQDSVSDDVAIMVPTMIFGDDLDTSSSTQETVDSGSSVYETSIEPNTTETVFPGSDEDINIIKPKVTKDLAETMANKIVKGFRFNLELIPYFVFNYSCTLNSEKHEPITDSGIISINGLTSNVEDWEENVETIHTLDEPHTKLDAKLNQDNALSMVKKAVMERNTKMIETREEYDSTIIFEKKKLKPKPEAIDIDSKGLFYLPVWCIEGSNGLMIIDANSGKVIKEDIFKAG